MTLLKKKNVFLLGQLRRAAHSDASVFEFQELMGWITRFESDSWVFRMSLETDPDYVSSLRYWVSFTIVTATYPCVSQASCSFSNDFIDDSLGKVLFDHQKFVCFWLLFLIPTVCLLYANMLHTACERESLLNFLFSRQAPTKKANLPPLDGCVWIQSSALPLGIEAFEDSAQRLNQQVYVHIGAKEFPSLGRDWVCIPLTDDGWSCSVFLQEICCFTQLLPGRLPVKRRKFQVNPVKSAVWVTSSDLQ